MIQTFDIPTRLELHAASLGWPEPYQLEDDYGLGGNRSFCYLGQPGWDEVDETLIWEEQLINELESVNIDEALEDDERYEELAEMLGGFDPGVASAVLCLAACGAVPFSSCNGGVFGDQHHEQYPLICFYCRPYHIAFLKRAGTASSIGFEHQGDYVIAYSGNIRSFMKFAREVHQMRDEIDRAGEKAGHRLSSGSE